MRIDYLISRLRRGIEQRLVASQQRVAGLRTVIDRHNPQQILGRHLENLANLRQRLIDLNQRHLERRVAVLERCSALLRSVSPLAVLERGYAIVLKMPGREIVRSSAEVAKGDRLEIRLHEGRLQCEVAKTLPVTGEGERK